MPTPIAPREERRRRHRSRWRSVDASRRAGAAFSSSPPLLALLLATLALAAGACSRPTPAPAPAPAPPAPERRAEPTPPARLDTLARARDSLAARDSAAAAARRDSLARVARRPPRRTPRRPAPKRAAERARVPRRHAGVRVCAGGDVTLGTNLDTSWTATAAVRLGRPVPALPPPATLVAPLRPLFADADVVLLNVEGAIGDGEAPSKCGPTSTACFALRQPPSAAEALRSVGAPDAVVVGNVANNHARDAGAEGLDETLDLLDSAGVLATGADSVPTEVVTAAGDTIAVLGFSTSGGDAPDARNLAAVRRYVAAAAARYRRVVVTVHMGAEGADAQRVRDSVEHYYGGSRGNPVAFARAATEAGADLVIGHGPHVVRALEWRGRSLVAYSLGNLVTYGPFQLRDPMNRGAVLCATLDGDGAPRSVALRPTRQRRPGRAAPDPSRRAAILADSLSRLDFPRSRARVTRKGSVVR